MQEHTGGIVYAPDFRDSLLYVLFTLKFQVLQEASGHVSVQEDSFNHGNRYTSKSILIYSCTAQLRNRQYNYISFVAPRSEGPAQVFLLTLTWLVTAFQHMTRDEWESIILCYDNMCHLNNLKVVKNPLPLPGITNGLTIALASLVPRPLPRF